MALIKLVLMANGTAGPAAEQFLVDMQEHGADPVPLAVSRFVEPPEAAAVWRIETLYAAADEDDVAVLAPGLGGYDWHIEPVRDANWVAEVHRTLSPVRAGRFLVHGPHDRAAALGSAFAIEIEASEAFGTAHHGSTRGCLEALDTLVPPQPRCVLDLGTGSGVLAIALAKTAPEARIVATDIDARSVEIAAANAVLNGVGKRITCLAANGLDHPQLHGARFDLILANILAEPLIMLACALTAATTPGGRLILSGMLDEQAGQVRAAYETSGARATASRSIEGWTTLVMIRD